MNLTVIMLVAGAVLLGALGVTGWLLKQSYEANGALEVQLKNANAVIAQREEDMKTSALEIAKLQGRVEQIANTAAPVRERIIHEKVTASCGPAIAAAVAGVRSLALTPTGGPPAGRQPPVVLQPAANPTR